MQRIGAYGIIQRDTFRQRHAVRKMNLYLLRCIAVCQVETGGEQDQSALAGRGRIDRQAAGVQIGKGVLCQSRNGNGTDISEHPILD